MENTKEQPSSIANLFGNKGEAVAEEPAVEAAEEQVETPEAEAAEEVAEVAVETPTAKSEETEESQPTLDEDGRVVVSFAEEGEEPQVEDVSTYKEQNKTLLEEIERLKSNSQLDPRISKLNEYVKGGGEINASFWELQNKDYTSLNVKEPKEALSAYKDKLKYIDGLDNDEVDFYIKKNFPALGGFDEDADDEEIQEESMKLRMEVKTALPKLKDYQEKVAMPKVDHNRAEQEKRNLDMYRAHSSSKLDEIKFFEMDLGSVKLNIPFEGKGREFARSVITEPENQAKFFAQRYVSKDTGDLDYQRFARDMYELENRDKIHAAILNQGKSMGKKEALEELQPESIATRKRQSSNDTKFESIKNISFKR